MGGLKENHRVTSWVLPCAVVAVFYFSSSPVQIIINFYCVQSCFYITVMTIFQITVIAPVTYYRLAVKHHDDTIIRSREQGDVEWEAPFPGRQIKPKQYLNLSNIVSINIHLQLDFPVQLGSKGTVLFLCVIYY